MKGEHLEPTEGISLAEVKSRAVKGVVVLTGRTFIFSLISFFATALLTVFLTPSEFGVFWIVSAVVNFFAYFSDVGLAAALIQKKEAIDKQDLKTTFTIQQLLVIGLLIILFLISPPIAKAYSLSSSGRILLYALGFCLFLSSLKTIPSVLMERSLEFGKLVIPQILEILVYNLAVVILAWKGFGITSFSVAVVARGIVGLTATYFLKPWLPAFAFSKESLKKLLSFGVPYQLNNFLAVIKDDGMTAFLGGVLGVGGVGLLGWAQKWAQAPLRFFLDQVIKVTFPAFSRLQDKKEELAAAVTRSIFFITLLVFPTLVGLLILAPILVAIIPKYEKWQPALMALNLIGINTVFAAVTTQLTNLLNSIGQIKVTFKLMIMWTVLTWVLVPFAAIKFGVVGAAASYALIGVSSLVAIYIAKRFVNFSLWESAVKPGVAALSMGVVLVFTKSILPVNLASLFLLVLIGLTVYWPLVYLLFGSSIITDVKKSFKAFWEK